MALIHTVLQGKGGVGKSLISALLAQYLHEQDIQPLCIDTDPVNATFSGYQSLDVKRLALLKNDEINTRQFDDLIEQIATSETHVVIDNGAASFVPLSHYLISNQVPNLLQSMGHQMIIHTIITGGQSLLDTISGFAQLATQFPEEASFVAWLNPYWGNIEHEGKSFEEMKAYSTNKQRLIATINLPMLKAETFGADFRNMLQRRQLFKEAATDSSLSIMERQRLKIIKDKIYQQLDSQLKPVLEKVRDAA